MSTMLMVFNEVTEMNDGESPFGELLPLENVTGHLVVLLLTSL
jgi:hypothetical protein